MIAFRKIFDTYYGGLKTKGSFTQNFAITFSGNVIAQLLGILFTPFIARIYGPSAYGVFALFIGLVNNLSPISTMQLPTGYVAAENDHEFFGVVKITLINLFIFTGLCTLTIFFLGDWLMDFFHVLEFRPYLNWVPIYLVFMGLDNILLGWNIRLKEFSRSAFAKITSTSASKAVSLLIGLVRQPSAAGLIIGNFMVYPIEIVLKFSKAVRHSTIFKTAKGHTVHELLSIIKKYKQYVFFVMPGVFVVNFGNLLPVYFFSMTFSESEVGYFALASSMVSLPLMLIINSSITVFLQKAAETINQSKAELSQLVFSVYKKLFPVGFLPLILLAFVSRWIFVLVFGAEWERAGLFVSFLCIASSFNVAYGPLSVLFRLMHLEKINFFCNVIFFALKLLGLWIGLFYNDILLSIIGFSIASAVSQWISMMIIFRSVNLSVWILLRDLIFVLLFAAVVIWVN